MAPAPVIEFARRGAVPPRDAEERAAAERLGPWRLVRPLAAGEFTDLLLARPDDVHPAAYVVKRLRAEFEDQPAVVATLRREAVVGRQVAHPHVVPTLSAHVSEPPYYLVQPYLGGTSLAARIARAERLPQREAVWIARQIAQGLAALHAAGWLHMDLKPTNVVVGPRGHATVIDLGFARRPAELHAARRTAVTLTPAYAAPEILCGTAIVDSRADLYSLGVTLFEMLIGQPPFRGDSPAELIAQHRRSPAPDVTAWRTGLSPTTGQLVRSLMAKDPFRRPASATDVVDRLVRLEVELLADG